MIFRHAAAKEDVRLQLSSYGPMMKHDPLQPLYPHLPLKTDNDEESQGQGERETRREE